MHEWEETEVNRRKCVLFSNFKCRDPGLPSKQCTFVLVNIPSPQGCKNLYHIFFSHL